MLRFVGKRLIYILTICILIIFTIFLGMGMARNSTARNPSYDVVRHGQRAWIYTRIFIEDLLSGELWHHSHHSPDDPGPLTCLVPKKQDRTPTTSTFFRFSCLS